MKYLRLEFGSLIGMSIQTGDSMFLGSSWILSLTALHIRGKGHDHEMVRALDYHPKAVSWVLGKPYCKVTDPQT